MLTEKLLNIFHKIFRSYIFKIIMVTAAVLLVVWATLELKDEKISFVYNNF